MENQLLVCITEESLTKLTFEIKILNDSLSVAGEIILIFFSLLETIR